MVRKKKEEMTVEGQGELTSYVERRAEEDGRGGGEGEGGGR